MRDAFADLIPLIHVDTVETESVICFKFRIGRPCKTGPTGETAIGQELGPGVVSICVDTVKAGLMPVAISVLKQGAETARVSLGPFYIQSPLLGSSFRSFHKFWEAVCTTTHASNSRMSSSLTNRIA